MDANGLGRGLPVSFLVVGAGPGAAQRAAAIGATPGARLAAVHDGDTVPNFDDDAVDAVVIASPHADRFAHAWAALEAGKHVLCEAPLALRPRQSRLLAARADELGRVLATGLPTRFLPPVRDAVALIAGWRIGRVETVRVRLRCPRPNGRGAAGGLMDGGLAACDLVRLFLGEVVAAQGRIPSGTDAPQAYAGFRDHAGGAAEIRAFWQTGADRGLAIDIEGTCGHLHIDTHRWHLAGRLAGGRPVFRSYLLERAAERGFRDRFGCPHALVHELEAFVDTIKGRRLSRPEASGWDGSRVLEMLDAVYRADRAGAEVPVHAPPLRRLGVAHQLAMSARRVA